MTPEKLIRVMIVDDHAVVRSGLTAFLSVFPDLVMVGEAGNGEEVLQLFPVLRPDVILMDFMMPKLNGAETIRALREHDGQVKIIILTSFKDETMVQAALQAGAISYLLKNVSAEELAEAIRAAYIGQPRIAPEATQALIQAAYGSSQHSVGEDLTDRERDVLALLAEGLNNIQIAERLVVSRSTVKFHVSGILSKLGATTRTEAVAIALKNKIVNK